ncbi:Imm50 family immunity protein [Hymenobacter sp. BT730]|uniref:Imm50 family immunity protein n=1 Tax=Hymenobacter sp. BT730 TaxID=3063332 RepID=UPI0026E0154D|nr:Imm50 family immunity protein [Hymenobacter sp. BT730]
MWYQLAEDYKAIEAVYGPEMPALQGGLLHEVNFEFNGYTQVVIRFSPLNSPSKPPLKWTANGFNTVSISLRRINIKAASLQGATFCRHCDITLVRRAEHLVLKVEAPELQLTIEFEWLFVDKISAY